MTKKIAKSGLKLAFTGLALYLVYRKVDTDLLLAIIREADLFYILLGGLSLALSKAISSLRLNQYFQSIGLTITELYNLKLYWKGMFYNLFLPGGIGGDGYKIYYLHKQFDKPVKPLGAAILLDRLTGLSILMLLLLIFGLTVGGEVAIPYWNESIYLGLSMFPLVSYLGVKMIFPSFLNKQWIGLGYSVLVQAFQLLGAYFILYGLSVQEGYLAYQFLFLVSSIVAVLPFTIGGAGARELTFTYGHDYLGVDLEISVAFAMLFFLVTSLSSLLGAMVKLEEK